MVTSSIAACELWKIRGCIVSSLGYNSEPRALLRMVLAKRPMNEKKTIKLNLASCTLKKARIIKLML